MATDGFEVTWAPGALRSINRLPEKVATACVEFIYGGLAQNPHRVGRPLRFDLVGHHSARRGDFRIIYVIDDDQHNVKVVAIDHRSDIYRPR